MKCRFAWSHIDFKKGGYAPCFRFKNYPGYWDNSGSDKLPSQVINNHDFISVRRQLLPVSNGGSKFKLGFLRAQIELGDKKRDLAFSAKTHF